MKGTHTRARPLYSANRLGLYEARARFVYTVPTGLGLYEGHAHASYSVGEEDNHDDHND